MLHLAHNASLPYEQTLLKSKKTASDAANPPVRAQLQAFWEASVELGNPVVFVGPNNSGKTTALQALALSDIGSKRWRETWRTGDIDEP